MKIYNRMIILVLLLVLSVPIFCACGKSVDKEDEKNPDVVELSEDVIKDNNIATVIVEEMPVTSSITTTGEIKRDEDKFYTINSMVQGRIISAPIKLGDYIKAGQVVAYIQNPEIARINAQTTSALHENRIGIHQAKTRYNLAKTNYEREKRLYSEGISPKKDLIQAESDLLLAKDELANYQERDTHIRQEATAVMTSYGVIPDFNSENIKSASPLTAMKSGIVTAKNVTLGSIVTPDQILYEVTDMNSLWLDIILYSQDIAEVQKGQTIEFIPDSYKNKVFMGKIDYIQPVSNTNTQTFTARAFIDNKDRLLQPGMYGAVKILSDKKAYKPFLPDDAIQKYGKETFVFIDAGDGKFVKRVVELGEKADNGYYAENGISKGDKIVTTGSFMLKSEMLKSEFAEED